MAVTRSCNPGNIAVELAASEGEFLEYRIPQADDNVQYVLSVDGGAPLFDRASCPPSCTHRWPAQGASAPPGTKSHNLAMQFIGNGRLVLEVDRKSREGEVLEVVKRCTFQNDSTSDDYYEPLRVVVS